MRKIETWLLKVIKVSRDNAYESKGNTTIIRRSWENCTVIAIYLHGNMIAKCDVNGWGFTMAGWPTPTTKSRINAIANAVGHPGVFTRKGKHYSGDKQVNAYDWF